jgi:hypothetical protein
LPFEFLQQVGLQVCSSGNFQHFKDGRQRDMVLQGMFLMEKKNELLVQIFQPQQCANTLIERVFVDDQSDVSLEERWAGNIYVILNEAMKNYKSCMSNES